PSLYAGGEAALESSVAWFAFEASGLEGAVSANRTCLGEPLMDDEINLRIQDSPFDPAAPDDSFLLPASGCLDIGDDALADEVFGAAGLDWREMTTQMDGTLDVTPVDPGFHY